MTRRRHGQRKRALTRWVVAGLCVAVVAVAFWAILPRFVFASSPRPGASNSTSTTAARSGDTVPSTTITTTTAATTTTATTVATTTTQTSTPGSGGRPLRLVQAGDSKAACTTDEPGPALNAVQAATGLTYNCLETFTDSDKTWADWVSPWIAGSSGGAYQGWVAADPSGRQLIDTQNLIPDSEKSNSSWTEECAAGAYNSYAAQFAVRMVSAGFGYAIIRLGHEMNGTWENDSLGTTVTQWRVWGKCFDQEVAAMRAVPGAHFLFDWSINEGYRNIPLADYYPGDSYVDIVGISLYDQSGYPLPRVGSPARWQALTSEPMGLNVVYAFAVLHHKPLGIPEWGTVSTQGDDAGYVVSVADFISRSDVAYQSWFDAGDFHIYQLSSAAPKSLAAYIRTIAKGR